MEVLIIGCGALGDRVRSRLVKRGTAVIGLRRSRPEDGIVCGDACDQGVYTRLQREHGAPHVILLTANPGLRGGGDHHVDAMVGAACSTFPGAQWIYSGSSAVYADAGGRDVDENGALAHSERAKRLIEIEAAVLTAGGTVLRAGALAGIRRAKASERHARGVITVRGSLKRALSWIHEDDLADLLIQGVDGALGAGVYNACAREYPTVEAFHRRWSAELGLPMRFDCQPGSVPERRVVSARLAREGLEPQWRDWAS